MRTIAFLTIASALALSACDKKPSGPKTAEEVVSEAAKLENPKPGKYVSTTTMLEFDAPGLPPEQAEQMRSMFSNLSAQEQTYCLTEEEANNGFRDALKRMGEGGNGMKCTFDRFDVSGNSIDSKMACSGGPGGKATMEMAGTVSEDRQDITMNVTQESPQIPGGKMSFKMRVDAKHAGQCT